MVRHKQIYFKAKNLVKVSDSDYDVKKLANKSQYTLLLTNGKIYSGLSLANFLRHNQSQTLLLGSKANSKSNVSQRQSCLL